jgi:hypothetical protein
MKKLLGMIAVLATVAGACLAVDYSNHMYTPRVYRVALGSGVAPSAADMATVGLHNGDMVLNTDDNVLYIMHATNVYTKVTSAGAVTVETLSADTVVGAPGTVSVTVTNGQAITLSASTPVIQLTSTGVAATETNIITIAQPYPVGYEFLLHVASGSTNLVGLADATTELSLGSDVSLDATDTLKIYTVATNKAVKVSTSDN